jgi:hypothetical protein
LEASFPCPGCRAVHHLTEYDLKLPWDRHSCQLNTEP